MATDDERREIAERLRKARVYTIVGKRSNGVMVEWHVALMSELAEAVGLKNAVDIEVFARLADLIEPDTTTPKCSEPTPKCDRAALLALADEMSDYTWYETEGDHRLAEGFADRIRKALGADDYDKLQIQHVVVLSHATN